MPKFVKIKFWIWSRTKVKINLTSQKIQIQTFNDFLKVEFNFTNNSNVKRFFKGGSHANVVDYIFDTKKEQWCELTLAFPVGGKNVDLSNVIRKAAEKSVLREVKNISRAFLIKNDKSELVITTEGT